MNQRKLHAKILAAFISVNWSVITPNTAGGAR
jgi:hypothetical protein